MEEGLLERVKRYAQAHGKSFGEVVQEALSQHVGGPAENSLQRSFEYADRLGLRLDGPIGTREERNIR